MKKFLTFVSLAVILFACLTAAFRMADMPRTYQGQDAAVPVGGLEVQIRSIELLVDAFRGYDAEMDLTHFRLSALATTSSIVPTLMNAASGRSSYFPSRISRKERTVSLTGTYLPGRPLNCSATANGWDRKLRIRLARLTILRSSSPSSSVTVLLPRCCRQTYSLLLSPS